jgi:hypothetical protein
MPNPNKIRGDSFERSIRDFARRAGFPWAERTRAGYERDHGDVHLDPVTRALIVQAKNVARPAWSEWLAGLAAQVGHAGATFGVLVVKRRGIAEPGRQLAVMELDDWLRLARAAGYGTPLGHAVDDAAEIDVESSA